MDKQDERDRDTWQRTDAERRAADAEAMHEQLVDATDLAIALRELWEAVNDYAWQVSRLRLWEWQARAMALEDELAAAREALEEIRSPLGRARTLDAIFAEYDIRRSPHTSPQRQRSVDRVEPPAR